MSGLRSKVSKRTSEFIKVAQTPAPPGPSAPPAPPMGGPAPAPGAPGAPQPPAPKPPIPAAPPMGGAPKTKEDIEQNVQKDIEKEKRQEQKLDSLERTVNSVNEKFDTLVTAITDMKKVIEQTMLGKPDVDEKFRVLKEKTTNPEKVTKTEFGVDDNNLRVSTEDRKMSAVEALRKSRKQRLGAADGREFDELQYHTKNPENKSYKQQVPAPVITKVKDDEIPDLFKVVALDLTDTEDQWVVVNKDTDEIYYVINKNATNEQEFAKKEFALGIIADMRSMGMEKAMEKHSAVCVKAFDMDMPPKPVVKDVPKVGPDIKQVEKKDDKALDLKEKIEQIKEKVKDKGEDKFPLKDMKEKVEDKKEEKFGSEEAQKPAIDAKQAANDFQRRFMRAFRLALSAQQKNLISNPLKAAWFKTLSELDVDNPAQVIEATFAKGAADHFEVAIVKAEEYLAMGDEAFVETESTIGELKTVTPEVPVTASRRQEANELRERATKSSVLFTTASAEDDDRHAQLSSALPSPRLAGISRLTR